MAIAIARHETKRRHGEARQVPTAATLATALPAVNTASRGSESGRNRWSAIAASTSISAAKGTNFRQDDLFGYQITQTASPRNRSIDQSAHRQ
jgi:hypothetical protein